MCIILLKARLHIEAHDIITVFIIINETKQTQNRLAALL